MITDNQIQKRIAEVMKYSGMKQCEIARALNIHENSISLYMKGERFPPITTLANLIKFLDEDANYVLCQDLILDGKTED